MNITHLLTAQAAERPGAIAIIDARTRITFAELADRSARAAAMLVAQSVRPGDHVLVFVPMSIDLYLALIAVFRAGAVATFLDPSAGIAHINHCCEIASPVALIGPPKVQLLRWGVKGLRKIPRCFTVGWRVPGTRGWAAGYRFPTSAAVVQRKSEDPALLTFTSGSTGRPKAAVRSHGFLTAQHHALARAIELTPGETDLATLPIFTLANLASGVTTVIPDANLRSVGKIDPQPVIQQIELHQPTRSVASPAFFERLLESGQTFDSFKNVYTGGAPVLPGLLKRMQSAMPHARVIAVYGSTEAEPIAHAGWHDMTPQDVEAMYAGRGLLAGHLVDEIDLRIIADQSGRPIAPMDSTQFDQITRPDGEPGEIVVHGDHVLKGYLGGAGDEQTKFRVGEQTWHRTGDAGYLDASRRLWLLGRAEAKIAHADGVVYPFAVECAASAIEGVRRSALVAHNGRRLLVVEANADAVQQVTDRLTWAKLAEVRRVEKIPLDKRHNAKVDYPALRKML